MSATRHVHDGKWCAACVEHGLGDRAVPLAEVGSFLPLDQIQRLRAIEHAARYIVSLGNQPGFDDEEWEGAFTALEEALR